LAARSLGVAWGTGADAFAGSDSAESDPCDWVFAVSFVGRPPDAVPCSVQPYATSREATGAMAVAPEGIAIPGLARRARVRTRLGAIAGRRRSQSL